MFKAYQRFGHPGIGELWSEACEGISMGDCQGECILELYKFDNPDPVEPGQELIYYLTLENIGDADCTGSGVLLYDYFDPNTIFIGSNIEPFATSTVQIEWNFGVMEPGDIQNIELYTLVRQETECGSILINEAQYYSDETNWGDMVIEETTVECPSECGDGTLDPGEECDDGNTDDGDGCDSNCEINRIDCPFTEIGDQILVNFTERIFSSRDNEYQELVNAFIPAGNYKVTLAAFDGKPERINSFQPHEQYEVILQNNGQFVAKSGMTDDLEDNIAYAWEVNIVNNSLFISTDINEVIANHAFYPDYTNPNSLNPICALFDPVGYCGDGITDTGEVCDDGINNGVECTPDYNSSCTYCSEICQEEELFGPYCGDGITNQGYEECDDGNQIDDDNCTNECMLPGLCRSDIDVVFVMDRSGSMGYEFPTRLSQAQDAANHFIDRLDLNDQSGLVSFSTTATLDKPADNNHGLTQSAINSLIAGGATNIGDAIDLANQELTVVNGNPQVVKMQILLTDGKANKPNGPGWGEDPLDVVYAETKAAEAALLGFKIFTIGLGNNVNGVMLQNIATMTGADYYFAPTGGDLDAIFEQIAFATCEYGSISGCKYNDSNNDGDLTGEQTIPGWEINLTGDATLSQLTDEQGCYQFAGLVAGNYTVAEGATTTNYIQTYPVGPSYYDVTLGHDEDAVDKDFGNYLFTCIDNDQDGYGEGCLPGSDCDDGDPTINPGVEEVCYNGLDDNCDGNIDEGCNNGPVCIDLDQDGYGEGCLPGPDCDDGDPTINPGVEEVCDNQVDDNCDGQTDEGCESVCIDNDQDGYGENCLSGPDCDDGNGAVNPGAGEICDNQIDDDCNGQIDEGCPTIVITISGGGGGPSTLYIHGEGAFEPGSASATITWHTNKPATSRVVYGLESVDPLGPWPNLGYLYSTPEYPDKVTFHSITISGLEPGLIYYFRPISSASPEVFGGEVMMLISAEVIIPEVIEEEPVEEELPPEEKTGGSEGSGGAVSGNGDAGSNLGEGGQIPGETGSAEPLDEEGEVLGERITIEDDIGTATTTEEEPLVIMPVETEDVGDQEQESEKCDDKGCVLADCLVNWWWLILILLAIIGYLVYVNYYKEEER